MDIPRFIDVMLRNGTITSISVTVPWMPPKCQHCKVYGHSEKTCPHKALVVETKVWLPKRKNDGKTSNNSEVEVKKKVGDEISPKRVRRGVVSTRELKLAVTSGSTNRFEVLDKVDEVKANAETNQNDTARPELHETMLEEVVVNSPRRTRAASAGVAELMKQLKNKKRGLNAPLKQKEFIVRIRTLQVDISCLLETRVKQNNMKQVLSNHFATWSVFHNYSTAYNGRIWFLWKSELNVELVADKDQSITCGVQYGTQNVYVTTIYGCDSEKDRRRLWTHLLTLHNRIADGVWILAGDFNIVAHPSESSDFNGSQVASLSVREFQNCMKKLGKREELAAAQIAALTQPARGDARRETKLISELHELLKAEKSLLRKKSRIQWSKEEDMNTGSFHRMVAAKQKKSTIKVLYDGEGNRLDTFSQISEEVVEFFKQLLGTVDDITREEINKAIFSQHSGKAVGPAGYNAHFIKFAWSIVGEDVARTIANFFQNGELLLAFNYTIIALVLPTLVSKNRSAFIKGRSITDNVLLAQELVRGYSRTMLSSRCALKIDLKKAFDSLNWDLLIIVLEAMRFPWRFINWVKSCITMPLFSLSINGGLVGYFKGARGVRQEDPMLPSLFVVAMNVVLRLLDTAAAHRVFSYHPKCKKIQLTRLSFADDLLIFTKWNLKSIQKVLELFYSFSDLQLNFTKSELYCTGVSRDKIDEILVAARFKHGSLPVRYLGVPLVTRRLSVGDCTPLVQKITARIQCWATRHLAYAGRLQLIQSVIFSLHNYWCRHFILPKQILKKITQLCLRFFWKGQTSIIKGAQVIWQVICRPKSKGGLELKDIEVWHQVCVLRRLWSIFTQAGSLWIAWIQSYVLKGRSIWEIPISHSCSWGLKKMLKLRSIASKFLTHTENGLIWKVPNYSTASV
ncbi:uncharacterized protein LOC111308033 [Durio zibethinus]|uniref:Uncharacterized protein LOC111308033 n=1 Tax=Durio zibethinus TaxID=66656 RepID=A0A6P6ABE8_DURZI|nr:uncharacterized protein LOC111308033 [Durio zibethinus]